MIDLEHNSDLVADYFTIMNEYQKELQAIREGDEVYNITFDKQDRGYGFIHTASHGYLVIPVGDKNYDIAKKIVKYGYVGQKAIYLEEDSEWCEFIRII